MDDSAQWGGQPADWTTAQSTPQGSDDSSMPAWARVFFQQSVDNQNDIRRLLSENSTQIRALSDNQVLLNNRLSAIENRPAPSVPAVDDLARRIASLEIARDRSTHSAPSFAQRPKMEAPAVYDGVGQEAARAFVNSWNVYFEYYADADGIDDDRRKVLLACSRMSGVANHWAQPFNDPHCELEERDSWDAFCSVFLQHFGDLVPVTTAAEALRTLSQRGRPITAYIAEFRKYQAALPAVERESAMLASNFRAGLDRSVRERLVTVPGSDTVSGLLNVLTKTIVPGLQSLNVTNSGHSSSAGGGYSKNQSSAAPKAPKDDSAMDVDAGRRGKAAQQSGAAEDRKGFV
ncbi:hypothetical protein CYLTODRAFT_427594 [Cylindrobasidium torrendii FP15055 ss-10]|uniref:Retrotransposon gag domain-containing protein n=1 Tax=Cylindrobasidium torrendii FP15055 ss-10 TaxID=1314674 RepID=A0A0D7AVM4_9AGAR|nr:hypothetical protein CYLTODRAFT_427594 [Cylindrobasidium torrendii FP15055 ss-10]